jgi:hypothetical protein
VSAIGLGRDYDEDLMQAIAENGGGRALITSSTPTRWPASSRMELGTMFETCAQDVDLSFTGQRPDHGGPDRGLR